MSCVFTNVDMLCFFLVLSASFTSVIWSDGYLERIPLSVVNLLPPPKACLRAFYPSPCLSLLLLSCTSTLLISPWPKLSVFPRSLPLLHLSYASPLLPNIWKSLSLLPPPSAFSLCLYCWLQLHFKNSQWPPMSFSHLSALVRDTWQNSINSGPFVTVPPLFMISSGSWILLQSANGPFPSLHLTIRTLLLVPASFTAELTFPGWRGLASIDL